MKFKLNYKRGEAHPNSVLSRSEINAIRYISRTQPEIRHSQLARAFGVSRSTITSILSGRTWRED